MATKYTNSGLCSCAKSMVGQAYWCGCYGQVCTEKLYNSKIAQYPNGAFPDEATVKQQIADGKRCMDCSGLVKGYRWGLTLTTDPVYDANTDWNQQGMYNHAVYKGPIATFPKKTGGLVFLGNSETSLTHVGVYCAEDDKVYHASTPENGVKVSTFKEFGATYWAQYSEIEDDTGLTDGESEKLKVDGIWGSKTTRRLQECFECKTVDGIVSDQWECYKKDNPGLEDSSWEWKKEPKDYSRVILALQQMLNLSWDEGGNGWIGPITIKKLQKHFGTTQDGCISNPSDVVKKLQEWLNED